MRGSEDPGAVGELFNQIAEEFRSQPMTEATVSLLDFIAAIPEVLVQDGIITAEEAEKTKAVIDRALMLMLEKRSRFVAAFIKGCRDACNEPLLDPGTEEKVA